MRIGLRRIVTAIIIALVVGLSGCGSDQDKVERGLETKSEADVAVPESQRQMNMTEEERQAAAIAAEEDEEEKEDAKRRETPSE